MSKTETTRQARTRKMPQRLRAQLNSEWRFERADSSAAGKTVRSKRREGRAGEPHVGDGIAEFKRRMRGGLGRNGGGVRVRYGAGKR